MAMELPQEILVGVVLETSSESSVISQGAPPFIADITGVYYCYYNHYYWYYNHYYW